MVADKQRVEKDSQVDNLKREISGRKKNQGSLRRVGLLRRARLLEKVIYLSNEMNI